MYWNFDSKPTDEDTVRWSMDFEKLQSDVVRGLRHREEEAAMYVVLDYLREQGYTVTEPGGASISGPALAKWLEAAIETNLKTRDEAKPYQASPDYWQGRAESYKLVLRLLKVGTFDG